MEIKRIIAIIILSILLISSVVLRFVTISSNAADIGVVYEATTAPSTMAPTTQPTQPTEPSLDLIIDTSIVYVKCKDNITLEQEIEKCKNYIIQLESIPVAEVAEEIVRVQEILSLYEKDALYMNKAIIDVPEAYTKRDFKSYEDYRAITSVGSPHYRLQKDYAYTNSDGIRMVNGRYCVALGSYFVRRIGQYIDIVLANGTVIPCILGDQKADAHTGSMHVAHSTDSSVVEFIVDRKVLPYLPKTMGSISYSYEEWRSPVVQVIVYDINIFDK